MLDDYDGPIGEAHLCPPHFPNRVYHWDLSGNDQRYARFNMYMATCAYCHTDYKIDKETFDAFEGILGEAKWLFPPEETEP